ncbi:serine acetyltransferase [Sandaracinobacter sp. RS1-74]|uniref:serine O-acetyltransferase EpsC n=1 Tax=Sandaracinobacteroides sayramensis TaxID=2913411 RepID=UPI001EDC2140|nr:serine O-acetyltransferase EpsC [Sandaracinobacteroides sayramensis]MCG2842448.1 serine acetyltransferase [Sandaracinobacteroides sayramensis]
MESSALADGEGGVAPPLDITGIADRLKAARARWRASQLQHREVGAIAFPSRRVIEPAMDALVAALFPLRLGPPDLLAENEDRFVADTLAFALRRLEQQTALEFAYWSEGTTGPDAAQLVASFAAELPALRGLLDTDVEAAFDGDPAARSVDEVLLCYPSLIAIIHHRLAHLIYRLGATLVARIISEIAHSRTGIDIHPGATIGASFFIDHGTGVVIGETAVIGNRVRIYQGVTLGARSFTAGPDGALRKGQARHPIVEDNVIIYAGATVLGRVVIGAGSVIGGNVWLMQDVPPESSVSQGKPVLAIRSRRRTESI